MSYINQLILRTIMEHKLVFWAVGADDSGCVSKFRKLSYLPNCGSL